MRAGGLSGGRGGALALRAQQAGRRQLEELVVGGVLRRRRLLVLRGAVK